MTVPGPSLAVMAALLVPGAPAGAGPGGNGPLHSARDCDEADFGATDPSRVAPTRTLHRGEIQVR
ncbi:MAG: hypothetical protein ACLGIO_11030 [Acidimicrobiia bacterium]